MVNKLKSIKELYKTAFTLAPFKCGTCNNLLFKGESMEKVNIVSREEREKKDKSGKYFVYKSADGREMLSKQKYEEGEQEFEVTPSKDGRILWLKKAGEPSAKSSSVKAPKADKGPLAGKSNELNLLGSSIELAKLWVKEGLVAKPKALDEMEEYIIEARTRLQKML